ncbi:hypothetical protein Pse7367_0734 [Thalassoporum mexicanum PCC 7367]|uniref:P-loop NTPase fold protein n=1 Tax=Thalassoporum mexicanum TaxID=3457544 RepID=UPI00029FC7A9|nr:P-loop NTPase fold protein [Pseudanabaena sp. PCC 7367]AFY69035.1 hypothetical protein Pse7367_0734 [Pseudanabaena sp. PCC 7367]
MELIKLSSFFTACNPSQVLTFNQATDRQYYLDFAKLRRSVKQFRRTINLSPQKPTCHYLSGFPGSGKTTELNYLAMELAHQNFAVVAIDAAKHLNLADLELVDLLLLIWWQIVGQVNGQLAAAQGSSQSGMDLELKSDYLDRFLIEVLEQSAIDLPEVNNFNDLGDRLGAAVLVMQRSGELRHQIRPAWEPKLKSLIEAVNQDLLAKIKPLLKQNSLKGLVVIVDNLDRLRSAQAQQLFMAKQDLLQLLSCHLVLSVPAVIYFNPEFNSIQTTQSLGAGANANKTQPESVVLSCLPVAPDNPGDHNQGLELLGQMILARAFPNLTPSDRLGQMHEICDRPQTLQRLCELSGGNTQQLLQYIYGCLQREDLPIRQNTLSEVIRALQSNLLATISAVEKQRLDYVRQHHRLPAEVYGRSPEARDAKQDVRAGYLDLLARSLLLEYADGQGFWYGVNPVLELN